MQKTLKIIYLSSGTFTKDSKEALDTLCKRVNISMDYLALSKLFYPKANFAGMLSNEEIQKQGLHNVARLDTLRELFAYLKRHYEQTTPHIFFIAFPPGARNTPAIISYLKSYFTSSTVAMHTVDVLPGFFKKKGPLANARVFLSRKRTQIKHFLGLLKTISVDVLAVRSVGAMEFYKSFGLIQSKTHIIPTCTRDINKITANQKFFNPPYPYILYLDSSFGAAADDTLDNFQTTYTYKQYLQNCKPFFEFLQKHFNAEVIIAAHPGSRELVDNEGTYCGFKYFRGQTCSMVKNALFCVSEHSTAVSFPIYYNKPLLYIYSKLCKEYEQKHGYDIRRDTHKYLYKETIYVDNIERGGAT